ncbi:hypothetical protein ACH5BA_36200 [Kitasatospora sp. NPDC018623]|uniref:hypothetical protein n=2 Tax=unclassified Kitasatospora TaxID=2633591 RepID=UPI00379891D9
MSPAQRRFADSDCIALTGNANAADPLKAEVIVDPADCNALTCTEAGLRVPETRVAGEAGCAGGDPADGTIGVVVVPPAAGDCPQVYTVGAHAIIDPAECNALTSTRAGLRVPETRVAGEAGCAGGDPADGTIGVVIVPPAAGDCPQVYTVGAHAIIDPTDCNALTSTRAGLRVPETHVTGVPGPVGGHPANGTIGVSVTRPGAGDCPQTYAVSAHAIIDPAECNALTSTGSGLRVPETRVTGTAAVSSDTHQTIGVVVTPPGAGDCPQTYAVSAHAVIDPADCNALTSTRAGLRVPETHVTGVPGPVGGQAVDGTIGVVVTRPAAGDCPQVYTVGAHAVIDPADCNALTSTRAGLRVPETRVVGVPGAAPGRVGRGWPSVDIAVEAPEAGVCPQTYTVRAYLTPRRGETGAVGDIDLLPSRASRAWVDTGLQVTLPDPGVYLVIGDIDTNICALLDYGSSTNLWTEVRLIDAGSRAVELGPRQSAQHQFSTSPETRFQHCVHGPTPLSGLVTVSEAQRSKTVRVQAILHGDGPGEGLNGAQLRTSYFQGGRSHLTYVKVGD